MGDPSEPGAPGNWQTPSRERALARLRDRFGDEFTSSLELEPGDRFIAVEDAGTFFASFAAASRAGILGAMTREANDREHPSNLVGYIDLDEAADLILVGFTVTAHEAGYSASVSAHDDDIRYEIERSQ